jgi:hypothetical protein
MSVNTVKANSVLASEQQKLDDGAAVTSHENKNSSRNVVYKNYRLHAAQHPAYVQEHVWPRVTGTECLWTQHCLFVLLHLHNKLDTLPLYTNLHNKLDTLPLYTNIHNKLDTLPLYTNLLL